MPARQNEEGKKKTLALNQLTPFAKKYLDIDPKDDSFESSMKDLWGALHGSVHGGLSTLNLYDQGTQIAVDMPTEGIDEIVKKSVSMTMLGVSAFARLSKQDESEKELIYKPLIESLSRF